MPTIGTHAPADTREFPSLDQLRHSAADLFDPHAYGIRRNSTTHGRHRITAYWDNNFEHLLREALPDLSPDQPLNPGQDLRSLGLNSMRVVELLIRLEEAYGRSLEDELLDHRAFATPAGLWAVVARLAAPAAQEDAR